MHWIDILVIATLLISGAFAYARGFVHEVLSIAGWIGAAFATIYGTPVLKHFTRQLIDTPFIADLITGILIFIGVLVILSIITKQISRGVKESALGALDRALGFLFGLLRGAVVVSLVWIGYEWTTPPKEQPEWLFDARTMPTIIRGASMLKALVPASDEEPQDGSLPADEQTSSQSLLDKAINSVTEAPSGTTTDGYGKKARTELDRLFETSK